MNRHEQKSVWVWVFFVVLIGTVFSAPQFAHGDNLYGSIRGTVTDASGAVVPGVTLTATNVDTGISYSASSNNDGAFSFLQLPIGNYTVRSSVTGFKAFQATDIHLNLDQIYSLAVKLEIGTTSETISVEANSAQVETTTMQLGTTVSGTQIVDLPLNGRNWTQLMQLQPGVQASSDRFGAGAYSTNGAETQQNSFLINGTDSNDTELNTPLVIPSPDAIGEFNLVTSTLNPEYGRNSGAIVNAAIKSGTNQFHGDGFEFYRDTFLDATPWFQTAPALFHQNQYGGTIGGPIVKDHAFIFFSYQGRRAVVPQPSAFANSYNGIEIGQPTPTVYTPAERGGDFSADTGGMPFSCPASSSCLSPFPMVGANGTTYPAGTPYGTLFPTGTIPSADLNALSLKLLGQYVPLPNGPNDSYLFNPLETAKRDQYLGRIDERISSKDSVWFYGLYENDDTVDDLAFVGSNLPGFPSADPEKFYEYTAAWNHTFSPNTLNEARFAYLRFNYEAVTPTSTQSPSAYGFTGISGTQAPNFAQLPVVSVTGRFSLGFSADGPQPRVQNTYQFVDNFSKVYGQHTLKFGFNMDRLEINNPFYNNLNGTYAFGGAGVFSTGNAAADFLLGIPDSYDQGSGSVIRARGREYYSYGQDQWQVKPSLTLTMGLAWDVETPYKNLYANGEVLSAFIPGEQSTVFPTAPVGLVFPGDRGVGPYGAATVHYGDFAPRLGFAYSPGDSHNWSLRGGIGIYYNRSESEATLQTLTNAPFSISTPGAGVFGTSPAFGNPYNSVNTATVGAFPSVCPAGCAQTANANPFPFAPPAPGSSPSFVPFEPIGFDEVVYSPSLTTPRATNYNLTLQYQVTKSTVASLGYVGMVARHLEGAYNLNPAGQAPGVNPTALGLGCTSDFFLGLCTGGAGFQYNPNVYGQIGVFATNWSSNYNALQAQIIRSFTNGLQFQASYTWSRNFDYTSNLENSAFNGPGFNDFNNGQNYGPSANDAPQRLVVSYVYTLPFYRYGHHFRALTDGWTLTGIGTFQHGFPVAVTTNSYNDLQWSYPDAFFANPSFADTTGQGIDVNHNPRNNTINGITNYWFNPGAFTAPPTGVIGTASRNPLYGPGLNFWDMAMEKDIYFKENMRMELRFETFNTFNHANFANPVNTVGNPLFGTVDTVQQISTNGAGRVVQLGAKFYF